MDYFMMMVDAFMIKGIQFSNQIFLKGKQLKTMAATMTIPFVYQFQVYSLHNYPLNDLLPLDKTTILENYDYIFAEPMSI